MNFKKCKIFKISHRCREQIERNDQLVERRTWILAWTQIRTNCSQRALQMFLGRVGCAGGLLASALFGQNEKLKKKLKK